MKTASVDALKKLQTFEIDGDTMYIRWESDFGELYTGPLTGVQRKTPHERSPYNILNTLSDDCFQAMFEHFRKRDMLTFSNFAGTCKRLQRLGNEIFLRDYTVNQKSFAEKMLKCARPLWRWEDHLQTFSSDAIEVIDISWQRHTNIMLYLIAKYCPKIQDITCTLNKQNSWVELRPLLCRLKALDVTIVDRFMYLADFLPQNSEIERLTVRARAHRFTSIALPKLEELNLLSSHNIVFYENEVDDFFERNSQLKRLRIGVSGHSTTNTTILYGLRHASNLEELQLFGRWNGETDRDTHLYNAFRALKQLKQFTFTNEDVYKYCSDQFDLFRGLMQAAISGIRDSEAPLEKLSLTTATKIQFSEIRAIEEIKTIQSLYIKMELLSDDNMLGLVDSLVRLVDFHFISSEISLNGIERYISNANPIQTARFELVLTRVDTVLSEMRPSIEAIDKLLSAHDLRLFVTIHVFRERNQTMLQVFLVLFFLCSFRLFEPRF